ncbi:hypothetical protein L1049_013488 [Liquidambar formosana]|uniref:Leucine-rich repeat-containing N-terminal plant-type domain-containing protein n=1 Tax=Liquidambar formosana TaxID=63359 RepID=A0AAP0WWW8_LIQFO
MGLFMCLCLLVIILLQAEVNCSSSFSSNSSSTQLCPHEQRLALLQLKDSFSPNSYASDSQCDKSNPKMLSWEEGTDCCSWDGVTCDRVTGHVIGLDLSCSWLQGTILSNSTLFLLPHLQRLNLAFNDFNGSEISSEYGQFTSLTHLNLSSSVFSGDIPSEISHLSKLVSLDLSFNMDSSTGSYLLSLTGSNLESLVQNLTELIELDLSGVDMSLTKVGSLANLNSSLVALSLQDCGLQGEFPNKASLRSFWILTWRRQSTFGVYSHRKLAGVAAASKDDYFAAVISNIVLDRGELNGGSSLTLVFG